MTYDPIADFLSEPRSEAEERAMLRWLERQVPNDSRAPKARWTIPSRAFPAAQLTAARAYLRRVLPDLKGD